MFRCGFMTIDLVLIQFVYLCIHFWICPDSASGDENVQSPGVAPVTWYDTPQPTPPSAVTKPEGIARQKGLSETLMMRSLARFGSDPTHLRLRSRRRFHSRVSPQVLSHAACSPLDPRSSWRKVLLWFSSSTVEILELLRRELTRPSRTAPLLHSCRIMKHAAAHTPLPKGHFQHSRASGDSDTPGGHYAAGSALRYTQLLPRFFLHQFPL